MVKRKNTAPQHLSIDQISELQQDFGSVNKRFVLTENVLENVKSSDENNTTAHEITSILAIDNNFGKKESNLQKNSGGSVNVILRKSIIAEASTQMLKLSTVRLAIDIDSPVSWQECDEAVMHLNPHPKQSAVQIGSTFHSLVEPMDLKLYSCLNNLCFGLQLDFLEDFLQITIYLLLNTSTVDLNVRNNDLVFVMNWLNSNLIPPKVSRQPHKEDVEALFRAVKQHHSEFPVECELPARHPSLRPELRLYQRQAVRWMLRRETYQVSMDNGRHCLFEPYITQCSKTFYYNKYTGATSLYAPPAPLLPTGGILADEMGLGKTVELLALILANPCSPIFDTTDTSPSSCKVKYANCIEEIEKMYEQTNVVKNIVNLETHFKAEYDEKTDVSKESIELLDKTGNNMNESSLVIEREDLEDTSVNSDTAPIVESGYEDERKGEENNILVANVPMELTVKKNRRGRNKPSRAAFRKVLTGRVRRRKKPQLSCADSVWETIEFVARCIDSVSETIEVVARGNLAEPIKCKKTVSLERQAVTKWYNDILATTCTTKRKVKKVSSENPVKCLCGKPTSKKRLVQCLDCNTWQHCKCVGIPDNCDELTYRCPQCWKRSECLVSRSTLIVSPSSISSQWVSEIRKHISDPSFTLFVYTGVRTGYVQPHELAKHNVVLTTYETLRKELNFADLDPSSTQKLRHDKRFVSATCPLTCVRWWRLCLDEAQMAQCVNTKTNEMAQRITAVHRWAVTGTPLHRDIHDLLGTVQYLGVEPYGQSRWWDMLISQPYNRGNPEPLYSLMSHIMWRTAKCDVLNQISIPRQIEEIHWLSFSPVEAFFYQRQHEAASTQFRFNQRLFKNMEEVSQIEQTKLNSLSRETMRKVLAPLLSLRQACAHPQVVSGNYITSAGSALTMEELLEGLIKKATTESEEMLRLNISALNGLAGVYIIMQDWATAVENYRSALRLWEEYKDRFSVDSLQLIHTCHNLADVLAAGHGGIAPTLRDDSLRQQAESLETKYLQWHQNQIAVTMTALAELTGSVDRLETEIHDALWWSQLIAQLVANGDETELLNKLNDTYQELGLKETQIQRNIVSSMHGLKYELSNWLDSLEEARDSATSQLAALQKAPQDSAMVQVAVNCHIRDIKAVTNKKDKCCVCRCESALKHYESLLFTKSSKWNQHSVVGDIVVYGQLTEGTWQATVQEVTLKTLLAFGRSKRIQDSWLTDGANHLKAFEVLKKEFRKARVVWMQLRDEIAARDELSMCRMRLRLSVPGEVQNKEESRLHIIDACDVNYQLDRLKSDKEVAEHDLHRKTGHFRYLTALRKKPDLESNPDPCPICQSSLGAKWSVLQCGHVYCMECVLMLRKSLHVKCAVCRDSTHARDVSYMSLQLNTDVDCQVSVRGSHSAKVVAIVRCMIKLRRSEPDVKVLIFSTWEKVLEVLEVALQQNHIEYERLRSGKAFHTSLQAFKTRASVTALLLPLRSGSKGLNLTEATHLIFVEPILNLGDELQALGRIHRIGQTKKTTVHRFLMLNTIEERIHKAVRSEHWQDDSITLGHLQNLFVTKIMPEECNVQNSDMNRDEHEDLIID